MEIEDQKISEKDNPYLTILKTIMNIFYNYVEKSLNNLETVEMGGLEIIKIDEGYNLNYLSTIYK